MDPCNLSAHPIPPADTLVINTTNSDRNLVDHTYRDFSYYLLKGGEVPRHKKSGSNFPAKLHQMISDDECSGIITWMPHGRAFKILDKELLISAMIPKYLSQTKFESFTRQLSGWSFKRLHQSGPDYGSYYHECFLRDIPLIAGLMRRAETNQGKPLPNPEEEPNFYDISSMYPLPPIHDGGPSISTTLQAGDRTPSFLMVPGSQSGHAMSTYQSLPEMQSNAARMRSTSYAQYPTSSLPRESSSAITPAAMLMTSSSYSSVPNMHCNEYAIAAQNPTRPIRQDQSTTSVYYAPDSTRFAEAQPIETSAFCMDNNHHPSFQTPTDVQAQANTYPHAYAPSYSSYQQYPDSCPPINSNYHYYGSSYHDNHSMQLRNHSQQVAAGTARSHCHDNQAHLTQDSNQSGSHQDRYDHSIPTLHGTNTAQQDSPSNDANTGKEQGTQREDDKGDFYITMNEFVDNFDF